MPTGGIPRRGRGRRAGTATVAVFLAVVLFVAASGIAGAGRGPEEADFTVESPGNRSSGTTDSNTDGASSRRPASTPRRRQKKQG